MTVNLTKLVNWYTSKVGTGTYSMEGSRNFKDGTADCSGSATEALYEAGASRPAYLYSTITLPAYLAANGFQCIAQNQNWDMKAGDVILWSDGTSMADSGGAGGHVMVAVDSTNEISTDYSHEGVPAVNEYNYARYYAANQPSYVEVWRLGGQSQTTTTTNKNLSKGIKKMIYVFSADGQNGSFFFDGTTTWGYADIVPNSGEAEKLYDHLTGTYGQVVGGSIPTQHKTAAQFALWVQQYPVHMVHVK